VERRLHSQAASDAHPAMKFLQRLYLPLRLLAVTGLMAVCGCLGVPETQTALPPTMPGVWRLTGALQVAEATDAISFDVGVP
jgi:hypothetical protein